MTLCMMLMQNYFVRCLTRGAASTHSCPNKENKLLSSSLRSRGHNYLLPLTEFSLYENSFVNGCLFTMI